MDTTPSSTPTKEENARFAIDGAIAFGMRGVNPPPDGHWLAEYWSIGKKLSDLAAMTARVAELERRSQEREALLLGHISEEEHMRFVERFQ